MNIRYKIFIKTLPICRFLKRYDNFEIRFYFSEAVTSNNVCTLLNQHDCRVHWIQNPDTLVLYECRCITKIISWFICISLYTIFMKHIFFNINLLIMIQETVFNKKLITNCLFHLFPIKCLNYTNYYSLSSRYSIFNPPL